MAKITDISQIKSELSVILSELSRNEPASSRAVVAEFRRRGHDLDKVIANEFVDTALIKILNQITGKRRIGFDENQITLFGEYPSIPGYIVVRRGGKRLRVRIGDAMPSDLEAHLKSRSEKPVKMSKQDVDIARLLERMRNEPGSEGSTASEFLKKFA